jgi:hypothetical protein
VRVGEKLVLKQIDPFLLAGARLLPFDAFIELKTRRGDLFINSEKFTSAVKDNNLVITFEKGPVDNPKVNAIALVKGGITNTHKESYDKYRQTMQQILREAQEEKQKEEQLFNTDLYDFNEAIDGQGFWNRLLSTSYLFDSLTILFLIVFFRVLPDSKQ